MCQTSGSWSPEGGKKTFLRVCKPKPTSGLDTDLPAEAPAEEVCLSDIHSKIGRHDPNTCHEHSRQQNKE